MATLHPRMFIAQGTLEAWLDSGNADVDQQRVHLSKVGRTYHLEPAVRVLAVVSDQGEDGLIGKVLTEQRISELGGELMGDSVLFGESAYTVEGGYVGTLSAES